MHRSSGIAPSALKPPRPPSKKKIVQMATSIQTDSCFGDEEGDKAWWMCNAEMAVHLVPVVLLACILILYVCSPVQFFEYEMLSDETGQNVVEMMMMTERHLQQAVSSKVQAEDQTLSRDMFSRGILENPNLDLEDHPSDLPLNPVMLRGFAS